MSHARLEIYHRLPPALRSVGASLRGVYLRHVRYGEETERLAGEAVEREHWSAERWKAWQDQRLASVLTWAAKAVPYYRELWERRRRRGDWASCEVLENWPVLRKEALRAQPRAFLAEDCSLGSMFPEQTSGTTGKPLNLWLSRETVRAWYALVESRIRGWNGVSRRDRWANIGGQLVVPVSQRKPPFWVWNAGLRQLYLSSFHLAPDAIASYLDALRRYRVTYILGYASSMFALAQAAMENGLEAPHLRVAISNSEPLYAFQRQRISEVFQCPVRDTYGMAESVCAASECEESSLHIWPEVGVTEIMHNEADDRVPPGHAGRLICTGLLNVEMPLIRYETGDRGTLAPAGQACACERRLPLMQGVEGRSVDVVVTPDGRRVGCADTIIAAGLHIREAQIVQERLNLVRVKVVPTNGFGPEDIQRIVREAQQRLGPEVEVVVEPVDRIPRTAGGKFRAVISRLDANGAADP